MDTYKQKITTAKRVLSERGLGGVFSVIIDEKVGYRWARLKRWLVDDNWYVGRGIELRGNIVRVDGCEFSVSSPAIPTKMKSRFLFDFYETWEREALKKYLNPSLPVVELGASIGVVSCITNRRLHSPQKHVVVEANPTVLPVLEENRDRNNCGFSVVHRAVAYGCDTITFHQSDDFLASSVQQSAERSITVPTISLREIVEHYGFEQFTLICDIEGGEVDLVKHDADIFRDRVMDVILEVHPNIVGAEPINEMVRRLEDMGFVKIYEVNFINGIIMLRKM